MKKRAGQKGTTMVSAIVAFAILMTASAMFYSAIKLSWNMIHKASEIRAKTESAAAEYYLNRNASNDKISGIGGGLYFDDGAGGFGMSFSPYCYQSSQGIDFYYIDENRY